MSLLWIQAVARDEPPESMLHDTHYRYLREHYEDRAEGNNPIAHDHYQPLQGETWQRNRGQGYHGGYQTVPHTRHPGANCTGWGPGECGHPPTQQVMRENNQQIWDYERKKLLDPEGHARDEAERQRSMDNFLSGWALDNPERSFKVHPETGELYHDDPRLG